MIIKALVENSSCNPSLGEEHGLSLFIETNSKKILFDTGASALFNENAQKLGVDLKRVDLAVISHGHYDHGGGLKTFLALNPTALVYVRENAFGPFYSERAGNSYEYIGLDSSLAKETQIIPTKEQLQLTEGISLFSAVWGTQYFPSGNCSLFKKEGRDYVPDDFSHEQNLVIEEDGICLLVAGCAHRGIVNILEHFYRERGNYPTHVIGGFHLFNHRTGKPESKETLSGIAHYLLNTGARFYTCHCTGEESFGFLRSKLGDHIEYLPGGKILTIRKKESKK
ncbi:metal-dependent hydrolase, beta-lactamase superfamily II [Sphaerochaeta pleomorpha str. Grapes]|uniref:Metal-dependent hydrolase, beta-lactamase superfamily II n=1 Tax=Sphaerochaeta pleomorpha (strain ATCC BAA-1885 / DSM 22778 / Grapes) TaxID=158190 RepID=G8QTY3_SPHPG|nr:MBL fold metallo-hydrolase [Sphaerochaeta pleomorpha]AEV29159.1 metal-dependent hydrolase, beta-lactamase superfamily II [Sphaerochaeta pleomorpha str. Grapes]